MYAPGDDVNKDAVIDLLVLEGEESECEDDDEDEEIDCGVDDSIDRRIDFPTDVDSSSEPCVSGM